MRAAMRARVTAKAGVAVADPGVEAVSEGEASVALAGMDRVETDPEAVRVGVDHVRVVGTVGASVPAAGPGPVVRVLVPDLVARVLV